VENLLLLHVAISLGALGLVLNYSSIPDCQTGGGGVARGLADCAASLPVVPACRGRMYAVAGLNVGGCYNPLGHYAKFPSSRENAVLVSVNR
jgi:hypothetical protein